jgi:transposase-like protein
MSSCPGGRAGHVCRKGYYLGSTADYVCVLCGAEFGEDDMDPAPTGARSPFHDPVRRRRRRPRH